MISVEKLSEGIRQEGVNFGLPTVFLKMGLGEDYPTVDSLVRDILMHTKCKWICIFGENTTQVGMGSLVKGLSSLGMLIEIECDGTVRDPGWLHTPDRWVVDWVPDSLFNYHALRSDDQIRFRVEGEGDLRNAKEGFEALRLFPGTKYIVLKEDVKGVFELIRNYNKSRVYRC